MSGWFSSSRGETQEGGDIGIHLADSQYSKNWHICAKQLYPNWKKKKKKTDFAVSDEINFETVVNSQYLNQQKYKFILKFKLANIYVSDFQ